MFVKKTMNPFEYLKKKQIDYKLKVISLKEIDDSDFDIKSNYYNSE